MWNHSQDPTYAIRFALGHFRRLHDLGSLFPDNVFVTHSIYEHCDSIYDTELGFIGQKRLQFYVQIHRELELPRRFSFYQVGVLLDCLYGEDGSTRLLVMNEIEGPPQQDCGIPF